MAAGLAHELNQPLAALMYVLAGAAKRAGSGALDQAQLLDALHTALAHGRRAAGIVGRFRAQAAGVRARRGKVQLNQVVRRARALSVPAAASSRVALRLDLDARLPPLVAERRSMEHLLLNLIGNAIEAVAEADGALREVVVRTLLLDGGVVEVAVEDSGTGLRRGQARRMFEPCYSTRPHGLGLGLSICKSIVEQHQGRIWAGNRGRDGACVRFRLPLRQRRP